MKEIDNFLHGHKTISPARRMSLFFVMNNTPHYGLILPFPKTTLFFFQIEGAIYG
jgi:hypothetical protein